MRRFTFFGLDRSGAVVASETIDAYQADDAAVEARRRRSRYFRIELWEGSILILREQGGSRG